MIQLFVGSKRVDLFKDENIEIQDSIQDAKDIGKIFTTFSRTFTVPANKNNNNVFQNFYNFDVVNGFDPREKVRSVITKNGATYRNGFIQIRKVKLKNNKPTSYTIFFTGLLSTLKDKLQDDRLSDLVELNNYDHVYKRENVQTGFETYLTINNNGSVNPEPVLTNSDVCYPFISVQDRYALNDSGKVKRVSNNGTVPTGSGGKVDYEDLKPAIRLVRIIEAIESQYDITFSNGFLKNFSIFTHLFMFLNRNKGRLGEEALLDIKLFNTDLNLLSQNNVISEDEVKVFREEDSSGFIIDSAMFKYSYGITATGSGPVSFKFIDQITNELIVEYSNDFDNNLFTFSIIVKPPDGVSPFERIYRPYLQIINNETGISNLQVDVNVEKSSSGSPQYSLFSDFQNTVQAVDDVIITKQIPKLKVIDFLTSIFKMFNLTAELVDDVIEVQPLDSFYDSGKEVDITRFVDISNSSVSKVDTIKRFNFKHEEANSLLLVKRNEFFDAEYGNLEKELEESTDIVLGGKELDIETNFYKILYERLRSDNGTLSNIMFGWYVDDNEEQLSNEPIIFYADKKTTIMDSISAIEFKNGNFTPGTYLAPLNATNDYTTNFSREINEHDLQEEEGLFNRFYSKYVARVFSPQSRKVELEAVLRDDFILSYKLNDIIIYKNRRHLINDISINLNTNKAKLTLLNIPIEVINFTANDDRSESLGLSVGNISAVTQGELRTFDIVSDSDWEIEIIVNWMTTETPTGSGNQTVSLGIAENTTGNARTGNVKVKTENLEQTITVEQAG